MRNLAILAACALLATALAGCAGGNGGGTPASSYTVKVNGAHDLQTKTRTIKVDLSEGTKALGSGSFTVGPSTQKEGKLVFERTATGPVTAKAFEGTNPVGVKTLDPAKCPRPLEFEVHVVDDAVHMYSNCD